MPIGVLLLTLNCYADGVTRYLPFDPVPIKASQKKVFAHYHIFPKNMGGSTRPIENDYYSAGWLDSNGENNKHMTQGGYLRDRPLSLPPNPSMSDEEFARACADADVRDAINAGLDGFIINFTSSSTNDNWWKGTYSHVWNAARRIGPDFKLMLMPDCNIGFKSGDVNLFVDLVDRFRDDANVFRHDGKIVLAPYFGERFTPEKWKDILAALEANGTPVFLVPCVQGYFRLAAAYASVAPGFSEWSAICDTIGNATKEAAGGAAKLVHDAGFSIWMQPVRPQDFRPHGGTVNEAGNTTLLRESWMRAIENGTDWVQIVTWSDHYESSAIRPTMGAQYLFADLSAYFASYFRNGTPPPVSRDALFYCYRQHSSKALADTARQTKGLPIKFRGSQPVDEIEVVGFLAAPAAIGISCAGVSKTRDAPAGMSVFTVPFTEGRPEFFITRAGKEIVRTRGRFTMSDAMVFSDFMYFGGSSLRERNYAADPAFILDGCVLELSCNEVWGPLVYDSSGYGHHATAYETTNENEITTLPHAYGKDANAVFFFAPGTPGRREKHLSIPMVAVLSPAQMTVCAWVKPANEANGYIIDARDGSAGFAFGFSAPGKIGFTAGALSAAAEVAVDTNAWMHIAAVCDAASAAIYINGAKTASAKGGAVAVRTGGSMTIAKGYYGGIDEFMLFDRALPERSIAAIAAGNAVVHVEK